MLTVHENLLQSWLPERSAAGQPIFAARLQRVPQPAGVRGRAHVQPDPVSDAKPAGREAQRQVHALRRAVVGETYTRYVLANVERLRGSQVVASRAEHTEHALRKQ